jgi:hypothetical protein
MHIPTLSDEKGPKQVFAAGSDGDFPEGFQPLTHTLEVLVVVESLK